MFLSPALYILKVLPPWGTMANTVGLGYFEFAHVSWGLSSMLGLGAQASLGMS